MGVLASVAAAFGTAWAQMPGAMHPAVVRVIATDRDGFSLGSGTLVAVSEHHGLVVTNWHVVRDAAGPIAVAFPNGFRSTASVLRTDREWDLAALAIWRPNVDPVPLAGVPPRPGEPLTIAGYGSGQYRTITGRCTQYVAPAPNQPFEMVELSAPARQGDSGGPIFNGRGELAGVLFGTAAGQTSGSYCGRVRAFLTAVRDDFFRLQPNPAVLAQRPTAASPPPALVASAPPATVPDRPASPSAISQAPPPDPNPAITANVSSPPTVAIAAGETGWPSASPQPAAGSLGGEVVAKLPDSNASGTPLWNDIKNYLAAIGVGAIVFHMMKFFSAASRASRRRRYY